MCFLIALIFNTLLFLPLNSLQGGEELSVQKPFSPSNSSELAEDHALYLSVIQINHELEAQKAQINIKVFTDDLQSALRNAFPDFKIVKEGVICDSAEVFIERYFVKHIKCLINGEQKLLAFQNCEKENDVYWLTFEMTCPKKWQSLKISADFFMELFPTQTNVLSVNNGAEKRFCRMTKKESNCETTF